MFIRGKTFFLRVTMPFTVYARRALGGIGGGRPATEEMDRGMADCVN